ncbi:unnamed protein product, partial [Polarella glacialis]
ILSTADSLFALQAMLRLVLVLSAVLRPSGSRGTVDASPMTGSTALFYLLAGIIRVTLLIVSPDHGLEGPLSGPVYLAFEVASLLPLMKLALGSSSSKDIPWRPAAVAVKVLCWAAAVTAAAVVSSQHQILLSGDKMLDGAFTMVNLLELVAAVICLFSTVLAGGGGAKGSFSSFAHIVLPIQQVLPMYFYLTAFDASLDDASLGHPLVLMQRCGALEIVLLLLAAMAHVALAEDAELSQEEELRLGSAGRGIADQVF